MGIFFMQDSFGSIKSETFDSGTDRHIAIEVTANNISTLYYFLTDERGNVTALTDESGNILERYRYRVYGDFEILDSQFTIMVQKNWTKNFSKSVLCS